MENRGEATHDSDVQPENLAQPEVQEGHSAFPWMGHYQATPVEAFPTLSGPIVHEGFVPDDDGGISLGNQAEYSPIWSASGPVRPIFQTGLAGRLGDQFTHRALPRSQNEMDRYPPFDGHDGGSPDRYSDDDNDSSVSYDGSE
jgi:hypothetical protein